MKHIYLIILFGVSISLFAQNNNCSSIDRLMIERESDTISHCYSKNDSVFYMVENMPRYCEGESEMYKYIFENLKISNISNRDGIDGVVSVRFIVTKAGQIKNLAAIGKNKNSKLSHSLIQVVESMKCWIPGKQRGIAVDVYKVISLNINLKESKK